MLDTSVKSQYRLLNLGGGKHRGTCRKIPYPRPRAEDEEAEETVEGHEGALAKTDVAAASRPFGPKYPIMEYLGLGYAQF